MSITVYYVDPVRVVYGERTNDDETRTEAKWAIETVADCRKLVGKKLGIRRTNGEYLRGWMQELPDASGELRILRESNRSEEVRVRIETIQVVEIIERSFPPKQGISAPGDYLRYCGRRVVIELTTGERVEGVVQDLSDTCRHLVLRRESRRAGMDPIPLAAIGAIEALGEDPPAAKPKRLKAGQRSRKRPRPSQDVPVKKCAHGRDPAFCCDCRYT